MINVYNKHILPWVTDKICGVGPVMKQRQKVIPLAEGRVLEIGVGSGHNLPLYNQEKIDHLFALEPSEEIFKKAGKRAGLCDFTIEFLKASSEEIPLDDREVDSIVITYTLCSIKDIEATFSEMRRVLKPRGKLIFCEHGLAPDEEVRKWQNRLNPVWNTFGGGCNLNRDIPRLIEEGSFQVEQLDTMYIPGFKPACFNYWGVARPG